MYVYVFGFHCIYFISSRVHARIVHIFPSCRYSRLGSLGDWDAPAGVLTSKFLFGSIFGDFWHDIDSLTYGTIVMDL